MSMWTHILGSLYVDTFIGRKDIVHVVKEMLKDAPKITGSERDADVIVSVKPGYNIHTTRDCISCQYGGTITHFDDGFECGAPEGFECPDGEYQSSVIITVIGDLRDRTRDRTTDEWNAFVKFIREGVRDGMGFWIRNETCSIQSN